MLRYLLSAAEKVLGDPSMKGLEIYSFRALHAPRRLDIRLDRLDHARGSPSSDDLEHFARLLQPELEAALGTEAAGEVSLEVSSPGAERLLRLPQDLKRFTGIPMRVEHVAEGGVRASQVLALESYDEAAGLTVWRLADVRANAVKKGMRLSKRQRAIAIRIPLSDLALVRMHVDW